MVTPADSGLVQDSVIGAMLIDERTIGPTLAQVQPDDFTSQPHRKLYMTIRKLFGAGATVDPVTVLDAIKADQSANWYDLIEKSMKNTPSTANQDVYIPILREQARLHRIQLLGSKLSLSTLDMASAQDCVAELNAQLVERPGVQVTDMAKGLQDFVERHKAKTTYLPWGFDELNEKLYVREGKFVILGGYPSDGKTALALSFAWKMAEKSKVGFFSLETDDGTLVDRLVSRVAGIAMPKIKRSDLSEADYATVAEMSSTMVSRKLELISASGMTVDDIFALAQSRRYDVIYIDYIQLIRGSRGRGRTEEITGISLDLHTKAQTTGITTVGLSQLSRPEKGSNRKAPTMSDLRESGQLEQDADVIMLLYREEPEIPNSRRVLKIAKNKEGEVGMMYMVFDGETQTFKKSMAQVPAPPKRKEPEYKQVQFQDLSDDTKVPF